MSEIARGHGLCLPAWKHSAVDLPRAASRSVVIVMIVMGGVPQSVTQVVDVIAVLHGGADAESCGLRGEASSPQGDDRPFAHVGWCRRRRTPPA